MIPGPSHDIISCIDTAFNNIRFDSGELAFLAATSKIELPIRDRLSWEMQQVIGDLNIVREWKRTDIAILKGEEPLSLLEIKAMYTFDATLCNYQQFIDALRKDEAKAMKHSRIDTQVFTLLLAANPKPKDIEQLPRFVKYRDRIKKALHETTPEKVAEFADRIVRDKFLNNGERNLRLHRSINGNGSFFGMDCDVLAWLFQPV